MDDTKQYVTQIKGTAYRFDPLSAADVERVGLVSTMNVSQAKMAKAMFRSLAAAAGPDQWDELTDRYVAGEVPLTEFTRVFKTLSERALKPSADDAE
jgi:hypothetical protein